VTENALETLAAEVGASGLVPSGSRGVAMLSGGPDSACLAAGLAGLLGPGGVTGLHLNYGLREGSDADEETCRRLCEGLGIELAVERPHLGAGNLQAAAREARYAAAERLREERGADWIATGHSRTDLAETMLYRLASSPGARALLGLPARRGKLVRPLLELNREELRALAEAAGLPFADDPSNADPRFARARLRGEVLPVLREINPAAEENIAATQAELAEDREALDALAAGLLEQAGASRGAAALPASALEEAPAAVRRLALRALAERAAGRPVALGPRVAAEIWRLAGRPEGGEVELGGGLSAVCEAGYVRFSFAEEGGGEIAAVDLTVPGEVRFGRWLVRAERPRGWLEPQGPEVATLDARLLGERLEVRAWRQGDRMRPLGLEGSKTLQDLFTDAGVPRSLRRALPVVLAGERIAWIAGVAVSEEFKLSDESTEVVLLSAALADPA
jgi:tRNA(Ile)-lysidine synthase